MIENRDILIFGEDWGRFPSTTQHIGKVLLEKNRVMWVGSLGHRKPRLSWADVKRVVEKLRNMVASKRPVSADDSESTPIKVAPFWIPYHDLAPLRALNRWSLIRTLRKEFDTHSFRNVIVITSTPLVGQVIAKLGVTSSHYLCLDDYTEFDDAFDALMNEENELLKQVDCSFSISDILVRTRVPSDGTSHFITQGVDASHFDRTRVSPPDALKGVQGPVIGFFGLISEWADLDLILYSAKQLPDYTFLMVGRITVDVSELRQLPNVRFTGLVPYADLPSYASVFTVGSIPFKINELTLACNPLKMFEYFALGLPVVSTALPEVIKFEPDVMVSHSREEYVDLLRRAVESDSPETRKQNRDLAMRYSWHAITETISEKVAIAESKARG